MPSLQEALLKSNLITVEQVKQIEKQRVKDNKKREGCQVCRNSGWVNTAPCYSCNPSGDKP